MALVEWNVWALLYLVLVVVAAAVVVTALVRIARAPRSAPPMAEPAAAAAPQGTLAEALAGGSPPEPYMAQWVYDTAGARVGETLGVAGDRVILKSGAEFKAVPLGQVRIEGGRLLAAADIDWADAVSRGEAWRAGGERAIRYDAQGMPVDDQPKGGA